MLTLYVFLKVKIQYVTENWTCPNLRNPNLKKNHFLLNSEHLKIQFPASSFQTFTFYIIVTISFHCRVILNLVLTDLVSTGLVLTGLVSFFQFHSHQIFHCFVIAGAFVHYHGISLMALYRLRAGECPLPPIDKECFITT